jgi:hypothetical protein
MTHWLACHLEYHSIAVVWTLMGSRDTKKSQTQHTYMFVQKRLYTCTYFCVQLHVIVQYILCRITSIDYLLYIPHTLALP